MLNTKNFEKAAGNGVSCKTKLEKSNRYIFSYKRNINLCLKIANQCEIENILYFSIFLDDEVIGTGISILIIIHSNSYFHLCL